MSSWIDYLLSKGAPDPDGAMAQADVPSGDLLAHIAGGLAKQGANTVQSAVTAPRDAYRGDLQVFDPATGHVSDEAMRRANEMAGIAMTGGLGGTAVRQGETVLGAGPIRAYHGSPHDFDRFDISHLGSGEGAQAYGHGLYFAENEGVARSYRDALRADPAIADSLAQLSLDAAGGDRGSALRSLKSKLRFADDPEDIARYTSAHDLLASGKDPHIPQGHMYEVGIDADPAKMLDWDRPLIGQYKGVQDVGNAALAAVQRQGHMTRDNLSTMTGGDLLFAMRKIGTPAEAASDLQAAGVPGVRFLDQGSRWGTVGDKSHNYVTFSDDIVKILRKYGLAGLAALGAGQGAVSNLGMGATPQGMSN